MTRSVEARPTSSALSRILSGSLGSVVYVLAFTPLEVVKVRQQAVAGPPASASGSASSPPIPSPLKAFHRGRGAVVLDCGLVLPKSAFPCLVAPQYRVSPGSRLFESLASMQAMTHHMEKPRGIVRTLLSISRNEGRAGLYAGLRPTLLAAVPNTAIYFTAYDEISAGLKNIARNDGGGSSRHPSYIPFVAGATARLIASVSTAPLEIVRTRQASSVGNTNTILEEFRVLLRTHGPMSLYRGLGPMILRDVPYSAVYFVGLEHFKSLLSDSSALGQWGARHYHERGVRTPAGVEAMQAIASGAAAGSIAVLVTTPFDVIKTRRQAVQQSPLGTGLGPGSVSSRCASQGTFGLMQQIIRDEGFFRGLWKGNTTRMVKVVPGHAIIFACYELGKRFFEGIV